MRRKRWHLSRTVSESAPWNEAGQLRLLSEPGGMADGVAQGRLQGQSFGESSWKTIPVTSEEVTRNACLSPSLSRPPPRGEQCCNSLPSESGEIFAHSLGLCIPPCFLLPANQTACQLCGHEAMPSKEAGKNEEEGHLGH